MEEEDEEIDVGIEDDSDEEVSRNNSKTIEDSNKVIFSCQQCGSLLGMEERFRGVRGFGIDELLSHKGTNEVCLMTIYLLLLFVCFG